MKQRKEGRRDAHAAVVYHKTGLDLKLDQQIPNFDSLHYSMVGGINLVKILALQIQIMKQQKTPFHREN